MSQVKYGSPEYDKINKQLSEGSSWAGSSFEEVFNRLNEYHKKVIDEIMREKRRTKKMIIFETKVTNSEGEDLGVIYYMEAHERHFFKSNKDVVLSAEDLQEIIGYLNAIQKLKEI